MKNRIEKVSSSLIRLERRMAESRRSTFSSSWEHWTVLDTINHSNIWKMSALEKVRKRQQGTDEFFFEEKALDEIDQEIYIVTSSQSIEKCKDFLDQVQRIMSEILADIRGRELERSLCPIGFDGNLEDYLCHELIRHPLRHYLHYGIRNDDYAFFREAESFSLKHAGLVLRDERMLDFSYFFDPQAVALPLPLGQAWEGDELYARIRQRTGLSLGTEGRRLP
jgi:hypothetical protein